MTRQELQTALLKDGIREDVFSLFGGHPTERYVLSQDGQKWSVYYSERGNEVGKRVFDSEDAACRYLYEKLIRDRLARRNPPPTLQG